MERWRIAPVKRAVGFIEDHLDGGVELNDVAAAVHYSKYHLHRMFKKAAGMPLHGYVARRRLTEAARMLVFTKRPVLEIALLCGYESQQAFTAAFRAMYKLPPAEYRRRRAFYPLQLRLSPRETALAGPVSKASVRFAGEGDIPAWMELAWSAVDGHPCLEEGAHLRALCAALGERRALVVRDGRGLAGAMIFSPGTGGIDFWGVHPQYRRGGLQKAFLDKLREDLLPGRALSVTTYRAGDRADTGYRETLTALGFSGGELLVEYGYPTQCFTLVPEGSAGGGTER